MNVCFVNPSSTRRPEIYDLAKHLPKDYNITILQPSSRTSQSQVSGICENIKVRRIPVVFLPVGDSVMTLPYPKTWMKESLTMVRETCDLVHVCDYEYLTSVYPLLAKKRYGIPMVIVNDSLLGIEGYSLGSLMLDFLSKAYTLSAGKRILEAYDRVVLLYSKLAKQAIGLGISESKIATIPNGIDIAEVSRFKEEIDVSRTRQKYGIKDDEHVILFVGRLVSIKRIHLIISTVIELAKQGYKVRALIVGDGPLRHQLEHSALPASEKVIFTGALQGREKYECYMLADLFMLPSRSEGLPTVLLESSAMGVPAVATNVNGIPDIVVHGQTGFLSDKSDFQSYEKYVKTLIENEDLAKEMGRKARAHVESNFSWSTIADKYAEIYETLS